MPHALAPAEVGLIPGRRWRSPRTAADYPVEWELRIAGRRLRL